MFEGIFQLDAAQILSGSNLLVISFEIMIAVTVIFLSILQGADESYQFPTQAKIVIVPDPEIMMVITGAVSGLLEKAVPYVKLLGLY